MAPSASPSSAASCRASTPHAHRRHRRPLRRHRRRRSTHARGVARRRARGRPASSATGAGAFIVDVKDGFVDALSNGLRLSARRHPRRGVRRLALPAGPGPRPAGRRRADEATPSPVDAPSVAAEPMAVADRAATPAARRPRRQARAGRAGPTPTRRSSPPRSSCSPRSAWPGCRWTSLAQRAGVGKATIYRRWDSKEALILDALRTIATPIPAPDEGNAARRPARLHRRRRRALRAGRGSDVLPHLIEASCYDEQLRASLDEYLRGPPGDDPRTILQRGIERGELPADTDVDLLVDVILGAVLLPPPAARAPRSTATSPTASSTRPALTSRGAERGHSASPARRSLRAPRRVDGRAP